jgi:nickel-dependent lactate racemase
MGEYTGSLHYGERIIEDFLPKKIVDEGRTIPIELPKAPKEIADIEKALDDAISKSQTPAKVPDLRTILTKHYRGGLVSIIVDDHTRPNVHTKLLLPLLLKKLQAMGVKHDSIRLLIAHGTHRAAKGEEYVHIFGEQVWESYKDVVEDHDCVKSVEVIGKLDDGIPVEMNRTAFASEVLIGLSDLDYHYFAGMGGGPKQLIPGVAGKNTITHEHLKMFGKVGFAEHVEMGILSHNPVYECKTRLVNFIDKALRGKGGWLYGIVTVVNAHDRLVHIVGGDVLETHRQGEPVLASVSTAKIPRLADVVIMAARHEGIDLYQAGKAFNSARHAVRPGGRIVVLAPLTDGWGSEEFKGLMAVGAPILQETAVRLKTAKADEKGRIADAGVEKALLAVQEVVMRDFKIGKQKPVDLLVTERMCGWGHLLLIQDGMSEKDEVMLPITFIGKSGDSPEKRLRDWIVKLEEETGGELNYLLVDDPGLLISAGQ